jgi:hypothetical protein
MKKRLAFWWIASNALALTAAFGAGLPLRDLWGWTACGAILGTAQWLALRRHLRLSPAWIAATCFAWTVGNWAGCAHGGFFHIPDPFWAGIVGGTLAGVAQSWVLWRQVSRPALWAPTTLVGWTLGWVAGVYIGYWVDARGGSELVTLFAAGAALGAVIGAASALPLSMMLRHPKPRPEAV